MKSHQALHTLPLFLNSHSGRKIMMKSSILLFIMYIALSSVPMSLGLNSSQSLSSSPASYEFKYHGGTIFTGPGSINIYVIWYGSFSPEDSALMADFFASFSPSIDLKAPREPSIKTWWKTTTSYKDKAGRSVSSTVRLVKQLGDIYSMGKSITRVQIANYIKSKIMSRKLPLDPRGIFLFLTSKDVMVEKFCVSSCGFHDNLVLSSKTIVYAHVGNPSVQCPGLCSWPYAQPAYGPPSKVLVAPNSVGLDGMILNIATTLAGASTNPFKNGYFQGDHLAPLEAVTACSGIFGSGAYPGYPGNLIKDDVTKASYNTYGVNKRKFLLPAMWDPISMTCKVIS